MTPRKSTSQSFRWLGKYLSRTGVSTSVGQVVSRDLFYIDFSNIHRFISFRIDSHFFTFYRYKITVADRMDPSETYNVKV